MKFRVHVSDALGFTLLLTLVLAIAMRTFFLNNRALAIEKARKAMADARAETDRALIEIVTPVHHVISTIAALVGR